MQFGHFASFFAILLGAFLFSQPKYHQALQSSPSYTRGISHLFQRQTCADSNCTVGYDCCTEYPGYCCPAGVACLFSNSTVLCNTTCTATSISCGVSCCLPGAYCDESNQLCYFSNSTSTTSPRVSVTTSAKATTIFGGGGATTTENSVSTSFVNPTTKSSPTSSEFKSPTSSSSSSSESSPSSQQTNGNSGLSNGAIAAIAASIGGVFVVTVIVIGLIICYRMRLRKAPAPSANLPGVEKPDDPENPMPADNVVPPSAVPSGRLRYPDVIEEAPSGRVASWS